MFDDLESKLKSRTFFGDNAAQLERRDILKVGLLGVIAASVPLISAKSAYAAGQSQWRVAFKHAHTGESYSGVYRVGDKYLPDAFKRMNYVLRDFRTHEVFPMDPHVLDLVSIIQNKMGTGKPIEVLSGYRSPKTNAMLRHGSDRTGVAKNSLHMYGQAIDIRADNYSSKRIRAIACGLKAGGVGYYPRSDFVHVDTGQVRTW
ncbi:MAG: DUF882 domain-containing protein [Alphaproteobacteria bacterium PRO2]|nr:DUF882 domain-containing protein [Alphaproteobacteria bacterium PRO2]